MHVSCPNPGQIEQIWAGFRHWKGHPSARFLRDDKLIAKFRAFRSECRVPSIFKNGFYAGLLAAFLVGLWLTRLWQPENQVRLHSQHLVRQIEQRNWAAAGNFVAPEYRDEWGNDRTLLLTRLRLTMRSFSSLTITANDPQTRLASAEGSWSTRIRIAGRGGDAAEVIARVNGLTQPFELHWRRQSRSPWDWKLVRVSNPALEISSDYY